MLKLKVKKLYKDAKLPTKAHSNDGGFDLYSLFNHRLESGETTKIETGIAVEIPPGHCGFIVDRSSLGSKGVHRHAGLIDESYRGQILVCLNNTNLPDFYFVEGDIEVDENTYEIKAGDKIAQMLILPVPTVEVEEVTELSDSDRGGKGFGSSGK